MRKNLVYIIVLFLSSFVSAAYGLSYDEQLLVPASFSATTLPSIAHSQGTHIQTTYQSSYKQDPCSFCRYRGGKGKHLNKEKKFFSFQTASSLVSSSGLPAFSNATVGYYQSYIPQLWRKLLFPKHYFW